MNYVLKLQGTGWIVLDGFYSTVSYVNKPEDATMFQTLASAVERRGEEDWDIHEVTFTTNKISVPKPSVELQQRLINKGALDANGTTVLNMSKLIKIVTKNEQ